MPLVPSILEEAMKQAFIAGETAMEREAKKNIDDATQKISNADIKKAGGEAFAAIAGPAIDIYIKSGVVNTAVVTAGTAAAQTGTGVGAVT
jgi:hypothetical protein